MLADGSPARRLRRGRFRGQAEAPIPAETGHYDVAVVKAIHADVREGRRFTVFEMLNVA